MINNMDPLATPHSLYDAEKELALLRVSYKATQALREQSFNHNVHIRLSLHLDNIILRGTFLREWIKTWKQLTPEK